MSEQMSAQELKNRIRGGYSRFSGANSISYTALWLSDEQAEALILADCKATVEHYILVLYDTMKEHGTVMNAVQIICTEKALDAVLEEKE